MRTSYKALCKMFFIEKPIRTSKQLDRKGKWISFMSQQGKQWVCITCFNTGFPTPKAGHSTTVLFWHYFKLHTIEF